MSFSTGIGIITFNRKPIVAETVDRVRELTRAPDVAMVVADDGSMDGTVDLLLRQGVPVVTGRNMGIAWNKNRAIFLLSQMLRCETVILLEDDTYPSLPGWDHDWIEATRRWGHVNLAQDHLKDYFVSGAGTVADPIMSTFTSAQCCAFSNECLAFGGFLDPRFRGYGHEHVEHSRRLIRVGYGGTDHVVDGQERVLYRLIRGDLTVENTHSFYNADQEKANLDVARAIMGQQGYRAPWRDDQEMRQFRDEIASAMKGSAERFRVTAR